jgi:predicted MPP superfamily phosphohydrolase
MGSPVPANGQLVPEFSGARPGPWFMFRGPTNFEWNPVRLPIPGLPPELAGFRLVHLSDLHLRGFWSKGYDQLIQRLEASPPDLLLITGDFIEDKHDHRPGLSQLRKLLPRLRSRLGTYAILGNHDVDLIQPYLRDMGVNLINGARAVLESSTAATVELIGFPGLARTDLDAHFVDTQPPRAPNTLRIILSHYPDHFSRARPLQPDLYLAGHTHGGQICLPGGVPLLTHDKLPRRYCKGIHRLHDSWLIVSRGLGFASEIPVRLFCPAEVAEITTIPAASQ